MIELKLLERTLGPSPLSPEPVIVAAARVTAPDRADAARRMRKLAELSADWLRPGREHEADPAGIVAFLVRWAHGLLCAKQGRLATARTEPADGAVRIVLGHYLPELSWRALNFGAQALRDVDRITPADMLRNTDDFWRRSAGHHPDFQAQVLMDYADRHGIPYRPMLTGSRLWLFGWGARSETFFESSGWDNSDMGAKCSVDKMKSKAIFQLLGAPIAPSVLVRDEGELPAAAKAVGFPCVTKPLDRGRSLGVTTNLANPAELVRGFRAARQYSKEPIMVEGHIDGEVHRIMVFRGKLWKAVRRDRPFIIGDGRSTVRELAERERARLAAAIPDGGFVSPPPLDDDFKRALAEQGVTEQTVPAAGRRLRLRNIPLLSTGATYADVTADVHPDVRQMSEAIARDFGLTSCGIDYVTTDIRQSCFGHGAFLEVNTTPGLRVPLMAGVDLDEIGRVVLGPTPAAIPLTLCVGPAEALEAVLSARPKPTGLGWVCSTRTGLGPLAFPDLVPDLSTAFDRVARHKTVDQLLVLCTPQELVRDGLVAKRVTRTYVIAGSELSDEWRKLLRERSEQYFEVATVGEVE